MESRECPTCGILNPGGNRICDDCGAALTAAPPLDWRRRLGLLKWRLRRANPGDLAVVGCLAGVLAIPTLYVLAILVYHYSPFIPETISEKNVKTTGEKETHGLRIQRDRLWGERFVFEFRRGDTVELSCTGRTSLDQLRPARWLQGHRAVLIEFKQYCVECITEQTRLFYVFGSGRLYIDAGKSLRCEGGQRLDLEAQDFEAILTSWE